MKVALDCYLSLKRFQGSTSQTQPPNRRAPQKGHAAAHVRSSIWRKTLLLVAHPSCLCVGARHQVVARDVLDAGGAGEPHHQREIVAQVFEHALGPERAARFWTGFRDTYIARDDIRFIKSVGFNTVRIPLHYRLFMTDQGEIEGEGWALLDRVLGWVREAGLLAIVDLHAAPGGQTGINHDDGPGYPLMFYVPRDRELTVRLWRAIAQRYSGDPAILGYDILNEPIAPYHDTATLNMRLEPFYKEVTQAIREVDPGRVVILAGGQWSSSFDMLGPPFAQNLAYTYHLFWASTKRDSVSPRTFTCNRSTEEST